MFLNSTWKENIIVIALSILPIYSWSNLFITWYKLRRKYKCDHLHYERHNCVVMYAHGRITGWPSNGPYKLQNPWEPILYFIETAKTSLEIGMMMIRVKELANSLISAHKRGVHIRIILDFGYKDNKLCNEMERAGIPIVYYVANGVSSIFHHKYMLKDYDNCNGYIYMGSLNWTLSAFQFNYENTVFTTNSTVVEEVHNAFEEDWLYLTHTAKNDAYVKAKLQGVV